MRPSGSGALIRSESRRRPAHPPPAAEPAPDRRLLTVANGGAAAAPAERTQLASGRGAAPRTLLDVDGLAFAELAETLYAPLSAAASSGAPPATLDQGDRT